MFTIPRNNFLHSYGVLPFFISKDTCNVTLSAISVYRNWNWTKMNVISFGKTETEKISKTETKLKWFEVWKTETEKNNKTEITKKLVQKLSMGNWLKVRKWCPNIIDVKVRT